MVEIAKPQPQPSAFWYDPYCFIAGIMQDDGKIDRPTSYRIRVGSEDQEKPTLGGLCIPSYDVPVEFRELSYVRSELWGPIKKYVVRNVFAVNLSKQPANAVVSRLIPKPKPGAESGVRLLLQSQRYDDVLKTEWRGYKALENALSINALFRNKRENEVTEYTPVSCVNTWTKSWSRPNSSGNWLNTLPEAPLRTGFTKWTTSIEYFGESSLAAMR